MKSVLVLPDLTTVSLFKARNVWINSCQTEGIVIISAGRFDPIKHDVFRIIFSLQLKQADVGNKIHQCTVRK